MDAYVDEAIKKEAGNLVAMSSDWQDAMKTYIEKCTGRRVSLRNFKRETGGRFTLLVSANGKEGCLFSGLQIDNPNHKQDRDEEMRAYQGQFTTEPFESPD